MNNQKRHDLQETASALGMTLEEYLEKPPKKTPPVPPDVRRERAQQNKKHIAALNWAAQERGTSYGKLLSTLTALDKEKIYDEYIQHLAEQEDPIHDAELRAIGQKIKRTGPRQIVISDERRRRFDKSLVNSNENTDVTELFQQNA